MDSRSGWLEVGFELADIADLVTMEHFRSEELRSIRKEDGTPVSIVDEATEEAMVAALASLDPEAAITGEEVGHRAGSNGRRWIFDGIDGTHNYSQGRTGWCTIIALEVDGEITVGVLTAPAIGQRWWAAKHGGAWTGSYTPATPGSPGSFDSASGVLLRCRGSNDAADLTDPKDARVIAAPFEGFLMGWRSEAATLWTQPAEPRSRCFALDAAMVAAGEIDAAVFFYGYVWDYAATSLIVAEAGGLFRDAWGTERLDTNTAVFAGPGVVDHIIDRLAPLRPDTPDVPRVSTTVAKSVIRGGSVELDPWRSFGLSTMPSMSARTQVEVAPAVVFDIVDERAAELARPFVGVTTDGRPVPGLRDLAGPHVDSGPIAEAAQSFLAALDPDQRARTTFAMDAPEWRMWINVHMNHFRHGVMLEDLPPTTRRLGLDLLRATLSAKGYDQARDIMRINGLLAELTGDHEAFGEWPYFVSIFGDPGGDVAWGWQIDGHHLCLNAVVIDGHLVLTPVFMGAEPRRINQGPLAGTSLFEPEERLGLDLIRSLDSNQRERAIVFPSIHPDQIPAKLQNLFDGRMQAGAFHDNLVAPYQGVAGADLSDAQRRLLSNLAGSYLGWGPGPQAGIRRREVDAHLNETWFSWYGGTGDADPFYYRVHSPVVLIEFDHHPGIVFDNWVPTRHHVHTVVRTPNGGDYGADLLALHHERFDHSHGRHLHR